MPRIGVESQRRKSLVSAALATIGEQGSLDIPVKDIAARAGMSPALAFHYFRDKDSIVAETMRHLLREFGAEARQRLERATSPRQRVEAIFDASLATSQFDRSTIAAWLVFYLRARSDPQAARLLRIYVARLRSNLVHALGALMPRAAALEAAETLASLIDGLYIRHALRPQGPDAVEAARICRACLDAALQSSSKEHTA